MKFDEAYNQHDSTALAALYTEDAVRVTPHGTFSGRQAIEKDYAKFDFQQYQSNEHVLKVDQVNAVGNDVRALGTWTSSFPDGSHAGRSHAGGHFTWTMVRAGDTWQVRRLLAARGNRKQHQAAAEANLSASVSTYDMSVGD
jgi:uncharacterized protein (TIGR02246 family)